jgi:POT family proton-dependent oligopeptide transporter
MSEALDTAKSTPAPKFPKAIPYIIGNEFAERFNYYGLRAILAPFLATTFYMAQANGNVETAEAMASAKTHMFITLNYFMPFIGGLVADWYWGKYKTILWLSLVYSIGSVLLAYGSGVPSLGFVSIGLYVIALGSGGIKPCVSANVGDQFDSSNAKLIPKAFDMFYFSINAGSMISILLTPWLYKVYGAVVAFAVPGLVMAMATVVFWLGRNKYKRVPPSGPKKDNFVSVNMAAMQNGFSFENVKDRFSAETIDGVKAVWRVLAVFAFIPAFWALYDQSTSEWVLQAGKLDLTFIPGITLIAPQVQTANAVLVLVFIPLFSVGIYPFVERMGIAVTPLRKIGAGFVMTALSFVLIAWLQMRVDGGEHPTVWWQILAYAILTAGEILISITGLEYAYTRSPKSMKSTIMAFWLLMVSVGNFIVSLINTNKAEGGFFARLQGATWYWFFFGFCAIVGLLFIIVSPRLKEKIYLND